jgi:hypothetical protein
MSTSWTTEEVNDLFPDSGPLVTATVREVAIIEMRTLVLGVLGTGGLNKGRQHSIVISAR